MKILLFFHYSQITTERLASLKGGPCAHGTTPNRNVGGKSFFLASGTSTKMGQPITRMTRDGTSESNGIDVDIMVDFRGATSFSTEEWADSAHDSHPDVM
eukprot:scaffold3419_cov84-Cylindrotheca_fusiformis.AAC.3